MPRPKKYRKVNCSPSSYYFKPRAVSLSVLEEIILEADELESLRLADYNAYTHEKSAEQMKISRATFGRIIEKARYKLVDAILNGKAIKISSELTITLKNMMTECKACLKRKVTVQNGLCSNCLKSN